LEELRQRRDFELAEEYCLRRLGEVGENAPLRADLTVELIRTFAAHAASAPAAERDVWWSRARQTATDFFARSPSHLRALLVRVQDALTPLAQGELARQEHEAGMLPAEQLEPSRAALREAASLLEELNRDLTRDIPLRRRTPAKEGELSADQLFTLQQQVQHQLARAQKNRALLFEPGADDRLALLVAAVETLKRPLAQLAADEPLAPSVQLELAECQRLLARYDEAELFAVKLDREGVDPAIRLRARAELIRLASARKQHEAIEPLLESREIEGQSAADLDFARFEAFLALAQGAKRADEKARQNHDKAAEAAAFLERTHGAYWGRRANQRLIAALPQGSGNVQLLARAAEALYLRRDFDKAIAAYDDGSAAARAAGDLIPAFDLAYKAALVEQQRGEHIAAANRLRILSKSFATHSKAAPAHLLAAWNAAQSIGGKPQNADSYAAILREHLATWPKAESADQARLWLGRLLESRGDWPEAIDAFADVERASPHFAAARLGLARAWPQHLAELSAAGRSTSDPAAEAIEMLRGALLDEMQRLPENWTDDDRSLALALAEIIVAYQASQSAEAVRLLEAALADAADAPPEWKAAAESHLALALADQPGRQREAQAVLARLAKDNPDNGLIQEKYAAVLLGSSDAANLKQALDHWRVIASRSRPRTPRWYKAKHAVAEAQFKLGDRAAAATLLKFVLETPPGLNGSPWEATYLDLLRKCERP
jgi:hypothetical protein